MDPCPFVRIVIGGLAVKLPAPSKPASAGIDPSSSPCFCRIKLKKFPSQIASIALISQQGDHIPASPAACFNLNKSKFDKLVLKSSKSGKPCSLKIEIYTSRRRNTCGLSSGELLGSISLPLDVKSVEPRTSTTIHRGWVSVGGLAQGSSAELHLNVRAEPDPRFVFQFDGEPECSPQVFQVNGNVRQPVFTCKFSFRNSGEYNLRSRLQLSEQSTSKNWFKNGTKEHQHVKERKGWSIMIHDLSGSPVAAASMVTPFVPLRRTDLVSRSNPGAWLILRPGDGTWKPWGRLEAWRERGFNHRVGYRFELLPDAATGCPEPVTLADSSISAKTGGKFAIDVGSGAGTSPASSRSSSCDFGSGSESGSCSGSGSWAELLYRGFVMSSTVEGEGRCSKPVVEIGLQYVTCTEDAAAFVALAAAMDLSMDACRPFSRKLRRELRQRKGEEFDRDV
ncbi:Laccase [Bertholletia excelsa]